MTSEKLKSIMSGIRIPKEFIIPGIMGTSALVVGVVCMSLAMSGFSAGKYYSDDTFGFEYGMLFDALTEEASVWMYVPRAIFVKSTLFNLAKVKKGKATPAQLLDIFPVSGKVNSTGSIKFEIFWMEDAEMPVLPKQNRLVPMAYIKKESQIHGALRYWMLFWVTVFRNWTLVKYTTWTCALLAIIGGFFWRYKNAQFKKQNSKGLFRRSATNS